MVNVDSLSPECRFHINECVGPFHARCRMIASVAMRIPVMCALVCAVAGCRDAERPVAAESDIGGTLVIAVSADPGAIFPPFAFRNHGRMIASQIYDHLADVGPEMNTIGDAGFVPQLAE